MPHATNAQAAGASSTPEMKKKRLWKRLGIVLGVTILLVGAGAFIFSRLAGPGADEAAMKLSMQLTDQPSPIPSSSQTDMVGNYCQIITPAIAQKLGATGAPINTKGFIGACDVPFEGGALVQISSAGPYGQLKSSDNPWFATPVSIARLEGRMYNLSAPLSGECTLKLNTRSVTAPMVNVRWYGINDLQRATKRSQSCDIAKRAAEVLAKAYVPLAGGVIYPKTIQRPAAQTIEPYPCKVVDNVAALRADVYDLADDKNGKQKERQSQQHQCTYQHGANKAVVTLNTSGKGLDAAMGADSTPRTLGVLPARQLKKGTTCSLTVELAPGILSDVTYTSGESGGDTACARAELMQASSVDTLTNIGSSTR